MATATSYDEWEDVGLAFTAEEVASYDPQKWAEDRVTYLVEKARVIQRRSTIPGLGKQVWCEEAAKRLLDVAAWYCRALEIPGIVREEALDLPSAKTADGRKLTSLAQAAEPENWLGALAAEGEVAMRYVVTVGRRASSRPDWKRAQGKQSNKLANCVMKEINVAAHLEAQLISHSG